MKKIYFLGIGGIGMSALARYYCSRGVEIYGYDKTETALTKKLIEEGMTIHYDENIEKIPTGIDLVVYTPAIPKTNKELQFLKKNNYKLRKRSEVLGMISQTQRTIAVAGTHGKTTTSTILTHILKTGGIDCTAFLGGISKNYESNYVAGKSDWIVVEADEYDRSFLALSPDIALVLSMDPDHLDIYGDESQMHESGFKAFLKKIKPEGQIFVKHNLAVSKSDSPEAAVFETFGLGNGDYRAEQIHVKDGWFVFDLQMDRFPEFSEISKTLRLALPGRHNIENAVAASAAAIQIGVQPAAIRKALESFEGIQRRFEFIYRSEKICYIDDYAHHPSELKAAIGAAKELFPNKKITGIFQPHLYSRTRDFQEGFAEELDKLDEIILLDIYPAREEPIPGVTSEIIFEKMKNTHKELVTKENLMERLKGKDIEVLMTLGAGDIDIFIIPILNYLKSIDGC